MGEAEGRRVGCTGGIVGGSSGWIMEGASDGWCEDGFWDGKDRMVYLMESRKVDGKLVQKV